MNNNNQVLVIAAHPDDEVLGCGGTIARHVLNGDVVHVLILAEGSTSRDLKRDRNERGLEITELARAAHASKEILGFSSLTMHDFPDNRMDSIDLLDIIKVVEYHLDKYQPSIVYTHSSADLNIDHRIANNAVVTACRPTLKLSVRTLLFFEVASSTEWRISNSSGQFEPNWHIDISQTLPKKLKALEEYHVEMRPWPHPRSLEAITYLARWRGASIGTEAAESFMVGRVTVR